MYSRGKFREEVRAIHFKCKNISNIHKYELVNAASAFEISGVKLSCFAVRLLGEQGRAGGGERMTAPGIEGR